MPECMTGGAKRRRGTKKRASKSRSSPTIKDRIKAGAKVHVGDRGGLFVVFNGKKHSIKC